MKTTVEKNLEMMVGTEPGHMQAVLILESFAGNAGDGAAANFYYDQYTGEIQYFQNIQFVPKLIAENYEPGTFRVTMDIKEGSEKIVEFLHGKITRKAKKTIESSIKEYNKRYSA